MKTLTRDDTQHGREYYDAAEVESELVVMIALRQAAYKKLATLKADLQAALDKATAVSK